MFVLLFLVFLAYAAGGWLGVLLFLVCAVGAAKAQGPRLGAPRPDEFGC